MENPLAPQGGMATWKEITGKAALLRQEAHPSRFRALGCGDPAGEGIAAVVWALAHRLRLGHPGLLRVGQLWRGDTLQSGVVRVGVRPLVGKGHVC
jgi:hypothetical protein